MSTRRVPLVTPLTACALSIFIAACAKSQVPEPVTAAKPPPAEVPFKNRYMSEFTPDFFGKPYNFRCGECSYSFGIDSCAGMGKATAIVRATVASQSAPISRCVERSLHDLTSQCESDAELKLGEVKVVRGDLDPRRADRIRVHFSYLHRGTAPRSSLVDQGAAYFLFLTPDTNQQLFDTELTAFAVCPTTPGIN